MTWETGKSQATDLTLRRAAGFTLIEVLVCVALMALLCAAIPLAITKMLPSARTTRAAQTLASDVQSMHAEALATGSSVTLVLTSSGYLLKSKRGNRQVAIGSTTHIRISNGQPNAALPALVAYPDGSITACQIDVLDSGRRIVMQVNGLTGAVRRLGR